MSSNTPTLADDLKRATDGLMFQSESDYPVEPFSMPAVEGKTLSGQDIIRARGLAPDSTITELKLDDFFAPVTTQQSWQGAEEKARGAAFRKLVELLKTNLSDIRVYRIGDDDAVVYVVGRTREGDYTGITTRIVET